MTRLLRGPAFARLGWLVMTLAMAAALVAGAWVSLRAATETVATMNRGQADLLEREIREMVGPNAVPNAAQLDTLVQSRASSGLRYLAVLDTDGRVLVEAGTRAAPIAFTPVQGGRGGPPAPLFETIGEVVRGYFPRPEPRGRGPQLLPNAPLNGRGGSGEPREGPPQDLWNVVEFKPLAAGLVASAERTLIVSSAGAILLTLAAVMFWRASVGREQANLKVEEQRRLAVLGEMSAVLAHEIRNPLASLKGNAQLLVERTAEGSRERQRAERVVGEAQRLEALTGDLLSFARSGPIEIAPTDPTQLLRQAADDAGGAIEVRSEGAPVSWPLDAGRVGQALANLLINARQMSPEGRPPLATIAQVGGMLVYQVRDFGPGLPEGSEERIFEPFFTTRTNGTGLGLAVARRVAEMHGGALSAASHPDGGAVFRLELPEGRSG